MHTRMQAASKVSCTLDQAQLPKTLPSASKHRPREKQEKTLRDWEHTHSCTAGLFAASNRPCCTKTKGHSCKCHTTALSQNTHMCTAHAAPHDSCAHNACNRPHTICSRPRHPHICTAPGESRTHANPLPSTTHNAVDYAAHPHITGNRAGRVPQNPLLLRRAHTHTIGHTLDCRRHVRHKRTHAREPSSESTAGDLLPGRASQSANNTPPAVRQQQAQEQQLSSRRRMHRSPLPLRPAPSPRCALRLRSPAQTHTARPAQTHTARHLLS